MRTINPSLLAQLKAKEYIPVYLFSATIYNFIFRFTTWDATVALGNSIYTPRGMDIGTISYGSATIANGCSITIDDTDKAVYSVLGSVGADDWSATLMLAVLDSYGQIVSSAITTVFKGFISEWVFSSGRTAIKLKSPFARWARQSTRLFSTSCNVKVFKSAQCGYIGAGKQCDRTYRQCRTYGNEANFQGFRWLEDLSSRRVDLTGETAPPAELPVYVGPAMIAPRR